MVYSLLWVVQDFVHQQYLYIHTDKQAQIINKAKQAENPSKKQKSWGVPLA